MIKYLLKLSMKKYVNTTNTSHKKITESVEVHRCLQLIAFDSLTHGRMITLMLYFKNASFNVLKIQPG